MKLLRSLPVLLLAMLGGGLSVVACGASADDMAEGAGSGSDGPTGPGAGTGGAPGGDGSVDVSNDTEPAPAPPGFAELCQADDLRDGQCTPDANQDECLDENTEDGGSTAPVLNACVLVPSGKGGAVGVCDAQGKGVYADPCQSALDCGAGLGCVPAAAGQRDDYGGACRNYCCKEVEACPADTYCAVQPMVEATDVDIPVCVPATNCKLLEPCGEGMACTVVRAAGTTSCVPAGDGHEGDACNEQGVCADGYMCAKLTNECKKLCHQGASEDCPTNMVCQGGSMEFPAGFGVCVASSDYN